VGHTARREHDTARAGGELPLPDLEHVLPLDDVEQLVLALVDVERGVERRDLLDDRERPARGVRGRLDEELGVAEPQALAAVRVELVAGRTRGHGRRL